MGSSAMGVLADVHSAAVSMGMQAPPSGDADSESSGCMPTLPGFVASHSSLENIPNACPYAV